MLAGLTARVGVGQCRQHVLPDADERAVAPVGAIAQDLEQGGPLDQLPHEIEALPVLAPVAQGDDAGVVEAAGRPHLGAHARGQPELDGDHLDGHLVAGGEVAGAVDHGRGPAADGRAEHVAPERAPVVGGVRGHGWGSSTIAAAFPARAGARGAAGARGTLAQQDAWASGGIGRHARFRV